MNMRKTTIQSLLACFLLTFLTTAHALDKPNIVLVFMDNFGWGEPGFNGAALSAGRRRPDSTPWHPKVSA